MADTLTTYTGRGPDGDFSIDLPAWAKEATQAKVVRQLELLNNKTKNLPANIGKAFEAALKNNSKALEELNKETKAQTKKQTQKSAADKKYQNKAQEAQDALANQMFNNAQALKELSDLTKKNGAGGNDGSLLDLAGKMGPVGKMFNILGGVVGGVTTALKGMIVAVTAVTGAVLNEFMKVFNLLNSGLREGIGNLVGAFSTDPVNLAGAASRAGLSVGEFTEAMIESSEEMRVLGVEGFVKLRNAVVDAEGGMYDLGYNQGEITKLLGREISIRQRLGMRLNLEGDALAEDVVDIQKELRNVSNAAGMSAQDLYQASKLSDETSTLLAARAREFGDDGISALQTSVRKLSMRISGLAPTFGAQVTEPLVNAMITGAVGLDQTFTDMVTVFPGLVDAFQIGRDQILSGGEISNDGITSIVETLQNVSDEEFNRAKMLALMTRNQSAIQMVNFASEVRARESLIDSLNQDNTDSIRSAATISTQLEIFFDLLKAPMENAVMMLASGILGVNLAGENANLGNLISRFSQETAALLKNIPIIGNIFDNEFFDSLTNAVDQFFKDGATESDRTEARKRLNDLITGTITEFGDEINRILNAGELGSTISTFFVDIMDNIMISLNQATGLFDKQAIDALVRQDRLGEALQFESGVLGADISDIINEDIAEAQKQIRNKAGFSHSDMIKANRGTGPVFVGPNKLPREAGVELAKAYQEPRNDFINLVRGMGYNRHAGASTEQLTEYLVRDANNSRSEYQQLARDILTEYFETTRGQIGTYSGQTGVNSFSAFGYAPLIDPDTKEKIPLTDAQEKNILDDKGNITYKTGTYNAMSANALLNNIVGAVPDRLNMFASTQATRLINDPGFREILKINKDGDQAITRDEFTELLRGINEKGEIDANNQGMVAEMIAALQLSDKENKALREQFTKFLNQLNHDNLLNTT